VSDRLFEIYESELKFLNEEIKEYVGKFEKIAKRLKLDPGNPQISSDPHVDRLLSSFSLLTARLRHKLEDEFPEITQSLLSIIYPQFLSPTPSVAIAKLQMSPVAAAGGQAILLPKGESFLTEEVEGCACHFRSTNSLEVLPIQVKRSDYKLPPFTNKPDPSWAGSIVSAIEIHFATHADTLDWTKIAPSGPLRFFLGGSGYQGNRIYEMLLSNLVGIGVFSSRNPSGIFLGKSALKPSDFTIDQTNSLVNFDHRTQPAFRILWEFFTMPARFRFVDLDIAEAWKACVEEDMSLVFYLDKNDPALRTSYSRDAIQLGCVPIINLFKKECESLTLDPWSTEYKLDFGSRFNETVEIYSVDRVSVSGGDGQREDEYYKLFQPQSVLGSERPDRFWHASRRHRAKSNEYRSRGSDVYLSLLDRSETSRFDESAVLHVETTCFNADLPKSLSVQSEIKSGRASLSVEFQTPPQATRRIGENENLLWKVVSHLSVNHLIQENDRTAQVLKETLHLYRSEQDSDTKNAIESIVSASYSRGTARLFERGYGEICRGLDIEIVVREEMLEVVGAYLFASALDRFFGSLVSINSFTRLTVRGQQKNIVIYKGQPRCGLRTLL
jgi:type VI secretion system protein ImpG